MTDKEKVLTPITDRVKFNWMYAHPAMNANQDVVRAETARELESIAEAFFHGLDHDLGGLGNRISFPVYVGSHHEGRVYALGDETEEVHQVVLGHAVVAGRSHRAAANLHLHRGVAEFGKGVDHKDARDWERVNWAEVLSCPVVDEVGA